MATKNNKFTLLGAVAGRWSLASILLVAALPGCSGPAQGLGDLLSDADQTKYAGQCRDRAAHHQKELSSGAYNPAVLFVHTWPRGGSGGDLFLPETRLVSAIEAGEVRRLLVVARGGMGKSRLAEAVRAQVCDSMPVFSVDLKAVAAAGPPPEGELTVRTLLARELAIEGKPDASRRLGELLGSQRSLVFLDAIEEVDLIARPLVMQQIQAFGDAYPQAQLALLARPPVFDDDYGFAGIDARLEIPPLECKVADTFIARAFKGDPERQGFTTFLKRHGLDEKGRFGLQCIYPYLSTYRDIQTLVAFQAQASQGDAAALTSRTRVFESLLAARLKKEFGNLGWAQAEALDMVDRLVRVQSEAAGQRTLTFDLPGCIRAIDAKWGATAVDAGVGGNSAERRRHVCEKTFQSAVFVKTEGTQSFAFSDRATTDLFLARWLAAEVTRANNDCSPIAKHTDLLGSAGVVRFLAGQPAGLRCLAEVMDGLCQRSDKIEASVTLLDEGLPGGAARSQPLRDARARLSSLAQKDCVGKVLDNLDKTAAPVP